MVQVSTGRSAAAVGTAPEGIHLGERTSSERTLVEETGSIISTSSELRRNTDRTGQPGDREEYEVLLVQHPEDRGYAVPCPVLDCASQGETREEALEMIADTIALYLDSFARDGEEAPHDPDAVGQMFAEYEADGCAVKKTAVQPADWDTIIVRCDVAILECPSDIKALVERGNTQLNKRDNDRAIGDYDVAISLDPGYAEAYRGRGDAHFSMRVYDRTIAD